MKKDYQTLKIDQYGSIISSQEAGKEIYDKIKELLDYSEHVIIDLGIIKTMATFCAKQIFGTLYMELSPEKFFERIELINVSDELKLIIRLGIISALQKE